MRTVGIDLSAQPAGTAVCSIEWSGAAANLHRVTVGADDEQLLEECEGADKIGIDCPFGWPAAFVEAVKQHHARHPWPQQQEEDPEQFRRRLRYRATDRHVKECTGIDPLSVSTDRIGVTAMRCAFLLTKFGKSDEVVDRSGAGRVVEVYPAAALRMWGILRPGYKKSTPEGRQKLASMFDDLARGELRGLSPESSHAERCRTEHDAFDSFVSALVARAAALSLTTPPQTDEQRAAAAREGWIHVPRTRPSSLLHGAG
jgi:predicted nuclease with RNAse H fold